MWLPSTLGRPSPDFPMGSGPSEGTKHLLTSGVLCSLLVLKAFEDTAFRVVSQTLITERDPVLGGWVSMISQKLLSRGLSNSPPSRAASPLTPPPAFISYIVARGRRPGQAGVWNPLDKQPRHQPRNEDCALKGMGPSGHRNVMEPGRHFRGLSSYFEAPGPWRISFLYGLI